jgi:hypothetical protein
MRFKGIIQKNAVVSFGGLMLQGQRDQVAKSAQWHEVLPTDQQVRFDTPHNGTAPRSNTFGGASSFPAFSRFGQGERTGLSYPS